MLAFPEKSFSEVYGSTLRGGGWGSNFKGGKCYITLESPLLINRATLCSFQFCATRKGTVQAAGILAKEAKFVMNPQHRQNLLKYANSLKDSKLRGSWSPCLCWSLILLSKQVWIKAVNSHEFPVSLTDFGNFSRLTARRHKAHGYL